MYHFKVLPQKEWLELPLQPETNEAIIFYGKHYWKIMSYKGKIFQITLFDHSIIKNEGHLTYSSTDIIFPDPIKLFKKALSFQQRLSNETISFWVTGTDLQITVWKAISNIPYGTVTSYSTIAKKIGHPRAVRAVANCIGKNPIAILLPCHRVIKNDGKIGGFAWGTEIKKDLLKEEGILFMKENRWNHLPPPNDKLNNYLCRCHNSSLKNKNMPIINISSIEDDRVSLFHSLTEAQLRNKLDMEKGIFIAESPKVIHVALNKGYEPISLLCEERHIRGDAQDIIKMHPDINVYTGTREILSKLTGYKLTRGVLCAMKRPKLLSVAKICSGANRIVVIDGVVDTTNIGAIFRSAAALGIDGILLTPSSCDPLNRRAVRVSMGSVFLIPWTWITEPIPSIKEYGFHTAAMALTNDSIALDNPLLKQISKLALIMGTEGDGLAHETIKEADYVVRIPMAHGVDSLNVAAASAVAFWELRKR